MCVPMGSGGRNLVFMCFKKWGFQFNHGVCDCMDFFFLVLEEIEVFERPLNTLNLMFKPIFRLVT